MSTNTEGTVGVSITAGHITAVDHPPHPRIGQQITMGNHAALTIHITPEVAAQWLPVIQKIAEGNK